jgi:hypothetical protein
MGSDPRRRGGSGAVVLALVGGLLALPAPDASAVLLRGELTQIGYPGACVADDDALPPVDPQRCITKDQLASLIHAAPSPDGKNVYVSSTVDDAVSIMVRDPNSGAPMRPPGVSAGSRVTTASRGRSTNPVRWW